ncbi:MAG: VTT domain-containing protein [Candidatus Thorarchaeota archaeon]
MQDIVAELILQGYLGLFIVCLAINLIPFISPSNMVLAALAMLLMFPGSYPLMEAIQLAIQVGIVVALAATVSKLILYYAMRGSRVILSESMLEKIELERQRVKKWGAIALLLSAGSPVPDDPIVIYCGLAEYSLPKFFASYYIGKVAVTIPGALIASAVSSLFGSIPSVIGSIALTAVILGIIFKRKTEGEQGVPKQESSRSEYSTDDE